MSILPFELYKYIFAKLPIIDRINCRIVCKSWVFILDSKDMWPDAYISPSRFVKNIECGDFEYWSSWILNNTNLIDDDFIRTILLVAYRDRNIKMMWIYKNLIKNHNFDIGFNFLYTIFHKACGSGCIYTVKILSKYVKYLYPDILRLCKKRMFKGFCKYNLPKLPHVIEKYNLTIDESYISGEIINKLEMRPSLFDINIVISILGHYKTYKIVENVLKTAIYNESKEIIYSCLNNCNLREGANDKYINCSEFRTVDFLVWVLELIGILPYQNLKLRGSALLRSVTFIYNMLLSCKNNWIILVNLIITNPRFSIIRTLISTEICALHENGCLFAHVLTMEGADLVEKLVSLLGENISIRDHIQCAYKKIHSSSPINFIAVESIINLSYHLKKLGYYDEIAKISNIIESFINL